ncbi:MAG TPA: hypothetical protein VH599_10230 [Ktedonobacterales bacterium]|jgi:hypothetical protein
MNRQEIEKYLRLVGEELQKRQITGEIILAGGAGISRTAGVHRRATVPVCNEGECRASARCP